MSAKIIQFKAQSAKSQDAKCSFCGTPESKAKAMVKGMSAAICDKCLAKATKLAAEEGGSA